MPQQAPFVELDRLLDHVDRKLSRGAEAGSRGETSEEETTLKKEVARLRAENVTLRESLDHLERRCRAILARLRVASS